MKIKKDFVLRKMGDNWMAVPVGKTASQIHGLIALNETAAALWKILETPHTLEEAVDQLCQEYQGDREEIRSSVEKLVAQMEKEGILE